MRGELRLRQERQRAEAREEDLSRRSCDDGLHRGAGIARHRCRGDCHACLDTFRAGESCAQKRQTRLRGEAVHVYLSAGDSAHRAGEPEQLADHGRPHVHFNDLADMAFITVYFPGNITAHINVNWLSPVKVRTTLIGGSDKMLVWNDLEPDEKIKVYDKGIDMTNGKSIYDLLVSYRSGDVWGPKVDATEALTFELGHFVDCILEGKTPSNDGAAGLRIVRLLEAAERSLKARGQIVAL